jgi:bacteriocin-like protein
LRYRWNGNHAAREWEIAMNVLKRTNAETEQLSDAELDQVSGGFSIQEMMSGLKLMGEMLSNVSKTRSEISMTFARNARA